MRELHIIVKEQPDKGSEIELEVKGGEYSRGEVVVLLKRVMEAIIKG